MEGYAHIFYSVYVATHYCRWQAEILTATRGLSYMEFDYSCLCQLLYIIVLFVIFIYFLFFYFIFYLQWLPAIGSCQALRE